MQKSPFLFRLVSISLAIQLLVTSMVYISVVLPASSKFSSVSRERGSLCGLGRLLSTPTSCQHLASLHWFSVSPSESKTMVLERKWLHVEAPRCTWPTCVFRLPQRTVVFSHVPSTSPSFSSERRITITADLSFAKTISSLIFKCVICIIRFLSRITSSGGI